MINKFIDEKYNTKKYIIPIICFLVTEVVLYAVYLSIDIFGKPDTVWVKYFSIVLCLLLLVITNRKKSFNFDCLLVTIALCWTLLADLFLLVINNYFVLGLIFFNLAQLTYFLRIYLSNSRFDNGLGHIKLSAIIRLVLTAIIYVAFIICKIEDATFYLASVYFVNLVGNAIDSFRLSKKNFKLKLFAVALIIFILCDINVGLFNVGSEFLTSKLYSIVSICMWLFYLPSQVLIVLSVYLKSEVL